MVWITGKHIKTTKLGPVWELSGIYDNEADAVEACKDEFYFVGPFPKNTSTPDETTNWPDCYYPKA